MALWTGLLLCAIVSSAAAADPRFDRDIRPILSDNCFHCHGPDANARKAKLRLDTRDSLFAPIKNRRPFVAGKPEASEAIRRILSDDPEEKMPPPDSKRKLTPMQKQQLQTWVKQGAPWQQHWAFAKPLRPTPPKIKNAQWPR